MSEGAAVEPGSPAAVSEVAAEAPQQEASAAGVSLPWFQFEVEPEAGG